MIRWRWLTLSLRVSVWLTQPTVDNTAATTRPSWQHCCDGASCWIQQCVAACCCCCWRVPSAVPCNACLSCGVVHRSFTHGLVGAALPGTVFAYGQTGSGKTFTMYGDWKKKERRGIIPRAAEFLFRVIAQRTLEEEKPETVPSSPSAAERSSPSRAGNHATDSATGEDEEPMEYIIKLSMVEIYKETVRDLLNPKGNNLKIRETERKGVWIDGVTQEFATCLQVR